MLSTFEKIRRSYFHKVVTAIILLTFLFSAVLPPQMGYAQSVYPAILNLPVPGTMVSLSPVYQPAIIKGITLHPEDPFLFDFIVNPGDDNMRGQELQNESTRLIKYFLAALTVPEDEMWVNLSPYEKNRIIPDGFGQTEMGRDLLAQDYLLKQLTASMMYPEDELGEEFWSRVHKRAYAEYGTTEIPMNTFNKIWIVPEKASVYVNDQTVYVVDSHLNVMLEEDYLALQHHTAESNGDDPITGITANIVREILIPEIEHEINHGKTFANLRQIFNSVILATWYKQNLKESILGQVYVDRGKIKGVDHQDTEINQKIYDQYVEAFKKGVYNYIKEDYDPATKAVIPRKYFSGGVTAKIPQITVESDSAMLIQDINQKDPIEVRVALKQIGPNIGEQQSDKAMLSMDKVDKAPGGVSAEHVSNIKGGLIGKYQILSDIDVDRGQSEIRFTGRHIETKQEEQIVLQIAKVLNKEEVLAKLAGGMTHTVINDIVTWFNEENTSAEVFILKRNPYQIHGMAEQQIIAISEDFEDEPLAYLHEIGEAMGAIGKLDAETILTYVQDQQWYQNHLAKANREGMELHYALRALLRELFLMEDLDFTHTIKRINEYEAEQAIMEDVSETKKAALLKELSEKHLNIVRAKREDRLREQGFVQRQYEFRTQWENIYETNDQIAEAIADFYFENIDVRLDPSRFVPFHQFVTDTFGENRREVQILTAKNIYNRLMHGKMLVEQRYYLMRLLSDILLADPKLDVEEVSAFTNILTNDLKSKVTEVSVELKEVADVKGFDDFFSYTKDEEFPMAKRVQSHVRRLLPSLMRQKGARVYFREDYKRRVNKIRNAQLKKRLRDIYEDSHKEHVVIGEIYKMLLRSRAGKIVLGSLVTLLEEDSLDMDQKIFILSILSSQEIDDDMELGYKLIQTAFKLEGKAEDAGHKAQILSFISTYSRHTGLVLNVRRDIFNYLKRDMPQALSKATKQGAQIDRYYHQSVGISDKGIDDDGESDKLDDLHSNHFRAISDVVYRAQALINLARNTLHIDKDSPFAKEIITYLTDITNDPRWGVHVKAEIIKALSRLIEDHSEQVNVYLAQELGSQIEAPMLDKTVSEIKEEIIPLLKSGKLNERSAYLLIMNYQSKAELLLSIIQDDDIDIRYRIYAFSWYASLQARSFPAVSTESERRKIILERENEINVIIALLADQAGAFLKDFAQDEQRIDALINDAILQDEEAKTYVMAVFLVLQKHLQLASPASFLAIAPTISRTRFVPFMKNSNSNFLFGGRLLWGSTQKAPLFLQIVAHEVMHAILFQEYNYHGRTLKKLIIHELLSDVLSFVFSEKLGLDIYTKTNADRYEKQYTDVVNDQFNTIEPHEGARAQLHLLQERLNVLNATFNWEQLLQTGIRVVTDPLVQMRSMEETMAIWLRAAYLEANSMTQIKQHDFYQRFFSTPATQEEGDSLRIKLLDKQGIDRSLRRDVAMLSKDEFDQRLGRALDGKEWSTAKFLQLAEATDATTPRKFSLREVTRDNIPRWAERIIPFKLEPRYNSDEQIIAIFRKIDDILTLQPQLREDLLKQVSTYAYVYAQDKTKFRGMRPAEMLRSVIDGISDYEKSEKVLVVLNNVIDYGLIKDGETPEGLAKKLNSDPKSWQELLVRHRDRIDIEGRKPYVLVVDDQVNEIEDLAADLSKAGYDIQIAENGLSGLSTAQRKRPDLIVTDVTMPQMNGIEFTRRLNELYPDIPVIVRSGQLGNGNYVSTMLSAFVRATFDNVVGVPGKKTQGTKTVNLVKTYLTQVDSAMLVRYERDLEKIGAVTPVSIMPIDAVGPLGARRIVQAARERGLKVEEVKAAGSIYSKGSYLIYHEKTVEQILGQEEYQRILKQSRIPMNTVLFMRFLAAGHDLDVFNREARFIIKQIFGGQLPPKTLNIRVTGELEELAGSLNRPYVVADSVGMLINELKQAIFFTKSRLGRGRFLSTTSEDEAVDLDREVRKLENLTKQLFTPEGEFDFERNQIRINGRAIKSLNRRIKATDRIVLKILPPPGADPRPEEVIDTQAMSFRSLYVNERFDAEGLVIMYKGAMSISRSMGIADITAERIKHLEKSGGYDLGYVLLRERDPQSGTIVEDNGEEGRLLRDRTLQPRIDAGKVSEVLGDWKVVQGDDLRAALRNKLKEEFNDIVDESRRVLDGEVDRSGRLTVVLTNFLDAVLKLQKMDAAMLGEPRTLKGARSVLDRHSELYSDGEKIKAIQMMGIPEPDLAMFSWEEYGGIIVISTFAGLIAANIAYEIIDRWLERREAYRLERERNKEVEAVKKFIEDGDERAIEPLVKVLVRYGYDYTYKMDPDTTKKTLLQFGETAFPQLVEELRKRKVVRETQAFYVIKDFFVSTGDTAVPYLTEIYETEEGLLKQSIGSILFELGWRPQDRQALVQFLVVHNAAEELATLSDVAVVPFMLDELRKARVSAKIKEAIGKNIRGQGLAAAPYLTKVYDTEDDPLKGFVGGLLVDIGWRPQGTQELVAFLVENGGTDELASWDDIAAVPFMLDVIKEGNASGKVKEAIRNSIVQQGIATAPHVRKLYDEEDRSQKNFARDVLFKIGWRPQGRQELVVFLVESRGEDELASLDDIAAMPFMLDSIKEGIATGTVKEAIKKNLVGQDEAVIPDLVRIYSDDEDTLRPFAGEVLFAKGWRPQDRQMLVEFLIMNDAKDELAGIDDDPTIQIMMEQLWRRYVDSEEDSFPALANHIFTNKREAAVPFLAKEYRRGGQYRKKSAEWLDSLGWQPQEALERLEFNLFRGNYDAVVAQGNPRAVSKLLALLKKDPSGTIVDSLSDLGAPDLEVAQTLLSYARAVPDNDSASKNTVSELILKLNVNKVLRSALMAEGLLNTEYVKKYKSAAKNNGGEEAETITYTERLLNSKLSQIENKKGVNQFYIDELFVEALRFVVEGKDFDIIFSRKRITHEPTGTWEFVGYVNVGGNESVGEWISDTGETWNEKYDGGSPPGTGGGSSIVETYHLREKDSAMLADNKQIAAIRSRLAAGFRWDEDLEERRREELLDVFARIAYLTNEKQALSLLKYVGKRDGIFVDLSVSEARWNFIGMHKTLMNDDVVLRLKKLIDATPQARDKFRKWIKYPDDFLMDAIKQLDQNIHVFDILESTVGIEAMARHFVEKKTFNYFDRMHIPKEEGIVDRLVEQYKTLIQDDRLGPRMMLALYDGEDEHRGQEGAASIFMRGLHFYTIDSQEKKDFLKFLGTDDVDTLFKMYPAAFLESFRLYQEKKPLLDRLVAKGIFSRENLRQLALTNISDFHGILVRADLDYYEEVLDDLPSAVADLLVKPYDDSVALDSLITAEHKTFAQRKIVEIHNTPEYFRGPESRKRLGVAHIAYLIDLYANKPDLFVGQPHIFHFLLRKPTLVTKIPEMFPGIIATETITRRADYHYTYDVDQLWLGVSMVMATIAHETIHGISYFNGVVRQSVHEWIGDMGAIDYLQRHGTAADVVQWTKIEHYKMNYYIAKYPLVAHAANLIYEGNMHHFRQESHTLARAQHQAMINILNRYRQGVFSVDWLDILDHVQAHFKGSDRRYQEDLANVVDPILGNYLRDKGYDVATDVVSPRFNQENSSLQWMREALKNSDMDAAMLAEDYALSAKVRSLIERNRTILSQLEVSAEQDEDQNIDYAQMAEVAQQRTQMLTEMAEDPSVPIELVDDLETSMARDEAILAVVITSAVAGSYQQAVRERTELIEEVKLETGAQNIVHFNGEGFELPDARGNIIRLDLSSIMPFRRVAPRNEHVARLLTNQILETVVTDDGANYSFLTLITPTIDKVIAELLDNAHFHGNSGNAQKPIYIHWTFDEKRRITIRVFDTNTKASETMVGTIPNALHKLSAWTVDDVGGSQNFLREVKKMWPIFDYSLESLSDNDQGVPRGTVAVVSVIIKDHTPQEISTFTTSKTNPYRSRKSIDQSMLAVDGADNLKLTLPEQEWDELNITIGKDEAALALITSSMLARYMNRTVLREQEMTESELANAAYWEVDANQITSISAEEEYWVNVRDNIVAIDLSSAIPLGRVAPLLQNVAGLVVYDIQKYLSSLSTKDFTYLWKLAPTMSQAINEMLKDAYFTGNNADPKRPIYISWSYDWDRTITVRVFDSYGRSRGDSLGRAAGTMYKLRMLMLMDKAISSPNYFVELNKLRPIFSYTWKELSADEQGLPTGRMAELSVTVSDHAEHELRSLGIEPPINVYRHFYTRFGGMDKPADAAPITQADVNEFSRKFLAPDAQLLPRDQRVLNETWGTENEPFGVAEVFFLPINDTRRRMAMFQNELKREFGDKVYLVDWNRLHFIVQGLEQQWDDRAKGTKKPLAVHRGVDQLDPEQGAIAAVRQKAASIATPPVEMQVARVDYNPQRGVYFELRPYLAEGQEDPIMQRRKAWGLPQPRPPLVTAAYFTQEFTPEELQRLRTLLEQYQNPLHFGKITVDNVEVIAYEDIAFNEEYRVLQEVPLIKETHEDQAQLAEKKAKGIDPVRRQIYRLRKDVLETHGSAKAQELTALLDEMDKWQKVGLTDSAEPLINAQGYPTAGFLNEILTYYQKRLVIYINSQAPIYALRGMLSAMDMEADDVTIVAGNQEMFELAKRYFPNVVFDVRQVRQNAIYMSFSDEGDVVRIKGVDHFDFLIPIEPFKTLARPEFDEKDIIKAREELRLGERKMMVLGSPKETELKQVLSAYKQLYDTVPIGQRPLLVIGSTILRDEQKFAAEYGVSESDLVIRHNHHDRLPNMENKSILILNTDGELASMYAVAEGRGIAILSEDRNLAEAGQYLPVLTFPGQWKNNWQMFLDMKDGIEFFKGAGQLDEFLTNEEFRRTFFERTTRSLQLYHKQAQQNPAIGEIERTFTLAVLEKELPTVSVKGLVLPQKYISPSAAHQLYILEQIYYQLKLHELSMPTAERARQIVNAYYEMADTGGFSDTELRRGLVDELSDIRELDVSVIQKLDQAMIGDVTNKGGIDLNPNNFDLQVEGDNVNMSHPTRIDKDQINNIQGFTPVIIHMVPITNLPFILGITEQTDPFQSAQGDASNDLSLYDPIDPIDRIDRFVLEPKFHINPAQPIT